MDDAGTAPPMRDATVLEAMASVVGTPNVLWDGAAMAPYLREPRGLYIGSALAVVKPAGTPEVAEIVRLCARENIALVPQGGNTGLVAGQLAIGYDDPVSFHAGAPGSRRAIVLSLTRMNRLLELDPVSNAMAVEAGMTLKAARAHAAAADRLYPLSIASEASCTIGGNLAANTGGLATLAYGNARALALGLEVVMANGQVMNLMGKLLKDNTGYDLKNLIIGSEGTLGIITRASLRLFQRPKAVVSAFIAIAEPAAALAILERLREAGAGMLVSCELMARIGLDFVLAHGHHLGSSCTDPFRAPAPWYVLLESNGGDGAHLRGQCEACLGRLREEGTLFDYVLADTPDARETLWRLREYLPQVQRFEGGSIKHDVSVPIAAIPNFIRAAEAAIKAFVPHARPVIFGHIGDGNIHINVSQPVGANTDAFLALWDEMNARVHAVVRGYGGSISAEHGIGYLKRAILPDHKDATALSYMWIIKRAFDPNAILNPGKTLA